MKIAVAGAGHLGKIHLRCIQQIPDWDLIGFYEINAQTRQQVSQELNVPAWDNFEELLEACDCLDIVTPTPYHFGLAQQALLKGKHVFIEKPVCSTLEEAKQLLDLSFQTGLVVQVGHVERFNPAFLALEGQSLHPMFVEIHRLAPFNPRGTDVSVVLDLMIHDLDLLLHLVKSEVIEISAHGVAVVSKTPDICNARLVFANGCTANLTASRISLKAMRKLRFFQPHMYISVDLLEKETQIVRLWNEHPGEGSGLVMPLETDDGEKYLQVVLPPVENNNAIVEELKSFLGAVKNGGPVKVTLEDGTEALDLAWKILAEAEKHDLPRR